MFASLELLFVVGCILMLIAGAWMLVVVARRRWRGMLLPLAVGLVGVAAIVSPAILARAVLDVDLGPREKIVDGEMHLTLTGWDRESYEVLKLRPDTVVLQMANPDVTDETLEYLLGMSKLRELDLNDSKITDVGLAILARFEKLEILRLRGTQISDDGFREHLIKLPSLKNIDVSQTAISAEVVDQWKAEGSRRRALR
ncbi:MAG: hypothetical protein KF851_16055 [Pirellulaceae bacterium]|jgi:hypothetical protein|nr:hypothetical protein [Pirellulaceae bacterium]